MAHLGDGGGGVVYRSDPSRGRCEKHLLSKTVSRAILRENGSQERMLRGSWKVLDREKVKSRMFIDRSMKAFRSRQLKKHGNWKREDEARLNCLNVPHVGSSPTSARPPGWQRLYTSPRYDEESSAVEGGAAVIAAAAAAAAASASGWGSSAVYVPLRPVVTVPRPGLELLLASGDRDGVESRRIVLARLPSAMHVDERQLRRYDSYRGKRFLEPDLVARDQRVANLIASLGPNATAAGDLSPFAAAAAAAAALPPIRSRAGRWRGAAIRPPERVASSPPPPLRQVASSEGSSGGSGASQYSSLMRRTLSSLLRVVAATNDSATEREESGSLSRIVSSL